MSGAGLGHHLARCEENVRLKGGSGIAIDGYSRSGRCEVFFPGSRRRRGGQCCYPRQLKRRYVLAFFEKLPSCLVGIEACGVM